MAKKRLAFDVEEDLHSRLKQLAAEQGVLLGAFCSSLIETGLEVNGLTSTSVEIDPSSYANLPLDALRTEANRISTARPKNWETAVRRINAEIVKRYVAR
jgi:hypothetical protein